MCKMGIGEICILFIELPIGIAYWFCPLTQVNGDRPGWDDLGQRWSPFGSLPYCVASQACASGTLLKTQARAKLQYNRQYTMQFTTKAHAKLQYNRQYNWQFNKQFN